MATLHILPKYQTLLRQLGLTRPADFLHLSGTIYGGHPDRHVAHLLLHTPTGPLPVFLKREHRVPLRERLKNALAGFGLVSRSLREFTLLRQLQAEGIGCPEPLAAGEDSQGRAFLLLREVPAATELRLMLQRCTSRQRRRLARQLGVALARLHQAGFDHPDLYSKHVLVQRDGNDDFSFCLLDWQRSRRWRRLPWPRRCADLAALEATLAEELASPRERLACLRAYVQAQPDQGRPPVSFRLLIQGITEQSHHLLSRRRIRELRQPALTAGQQNLIWLDGEALCVTHAFYEQIQGRVPAYLQKLYPPIMQRQPADTAAQRLQQRRQFRLLSWLWSLLRRRPLISPELQQASILFRLERYRVRTPRLLAVGQKQTYPGCLDSFLLTELPLAAVPLAQWLATCVNRQQRQQVLQVAANTLRAIHAAGCQLGATAQLLVQCSPGGDLAVSVDSAAGMQPTGRLTETARRDDLLRLYKLCGRFCRRSESLRFLLHYLEAARLTAAGRLLAGAIHGGRASRHRGGTERRYAA